MSHGVFGEKKGEEGTPALLGVPGSGREGAGMGEVAGCMDLEEAG